MRRAFRHHIRSWGQWASGRQTRRPGRMRRTGLESLEPRQVLDAMPVISEVLASNDRVINDEDGDDSDFIELYNAGDSDMSLNRWYLTDNPGDLQKWRFPDVSLNAGEYRVVFASNKDRNDPAGQLHTNFQLAAGGEYLALVQPDGQTIAFEYKPGYPKQVTDVSYGIPTGMRMTPLVTAGSAARIHVPTNDSLDQKEPDVTTGTWLSPTYDDTGAGWFGGTVGVGYVPPDEPVVMGDSVAEFSGVQGKDNWYYGTWTKNFDSDKKYAASEFGALSAERFFDAAKNLWDVGPNGANPSTELTPTGGHPATASAGGFFTHWAIRRWVSETDGEISIQGTLANNDPAGDGIVGRILVNGTEVFQRAVNGASGTYDVKATVKQGDLVDFVIDAGPADNELGDATTFTAVVRGKPIRVLPEAAVADSNPDWSKTGVQGNANWYYGIFDARSDKDGQYSAADFIQFPSNAWLTTRYVWQEAGITTDMRSTSQQPHADAKGLHWAIRRWQSPYTGSLAVRYEVSKALNTGDGVFVRVFHNGKQVDAIPIAGTDSSSITGSVILRGVKQGDKIDVAVDPVGPGVPAPQATGTDDRTSVRVTIARIGDIAESIQTDIRKQMQGISPGAYLRIPFDVPNMNALDRILLNVKYDDGFVAYINGHQVAAGNIPDSVSWNATSPAVRSALDATLFETIELTNQRDVFVPGRNVLQIHALNSSINDDELLVLPELVIGTLAAEVGQGRYFAKPSPGAPNGLGAAELGPLVSDVTHSPNVPTTTEAILVVADVSRTFHDVATVDLTYRVMYGDRITIPMRDDGQNGDALANDGRFTATIPAGLAKPGEMIRWYVTTTDNQNQRSRSPAFQDALDSQEYYGTIVADPTTQSQLPVFYWFVENFAKATSAVGSSGSMFYDGEFYDNIFTNLHGQSSSGFPTTKKSVNIDFPVDHRFRLRDDLARMKDIDFLTNFADKSKMRNTLAYEQLAATGGPHHLAFPIRVHRNGTFYAVYDFVEDADENFLERLGFDGRNSLYKIYNSFESFAGAEKKSGDKTTNQDLKDIIAALKLPIGPKLDYIYDNVNLAQMANFLAGFVVTHGHDCCHKNYYAYRDTYETGEWFFYPWDQDLTQGRLWGGFGLAYFDDTIYSNVGLYMGSGNVLISALYNQVPGFKDMYLRRVRTLLDDYIKPPGTPADQLPFEKRVAELYAMMKPDADLDNQLNPAKWGQTGFQTFDKAVQIMLEEYMIQRRNWLYTTQVQPDPGESPVFISGEPGAASGRYFIPTDNSLGLNWTKTDFNDKSWPSAPMGIGFEQGATNYKDLIKTDLSADLNGKTSLYARIPFQVDNLAAIKALSLRMKYEDGYVAYLNGVEIARKGLVQAEPTFDSTARSRAVSSAVVFENLNLTNKLSLLQQGQNILAVHSLNTSPTSTDMFFLPELVAADLTTARGEVPMRQVGNPKINFGEIDFAPASGNQNEEYIQLVNTNLAAVDISGWKLIGAVEKTFDPGTVLVAGGKLHVAADAKSFRARKNGPTGGQRLFVQGNYDNRLPNEGGLVQLVARDGALVSEFRYQGTVSPLQDNLRITEIMYNPLDASADELAKDKSLVSEDFEYIELKNISSDKTLDLVGARFTQGLSFDFTGSRITKLTPGETVLLVRNEGAFALRYGQGALARVAGIFAANTALADTGETITLLGGDGATVAEFAYSDDAHRGWPLRADGHGSSLQVVDVRGDYTLGSNWRPSTEINGSPARDGRAALAGPVINEVRSLTTEANGDEIEIYNPTQLTVSLQNYFLSDSSATINAFRKYAFPGALISPGGYLVVDERAINSGGPIGFGLNGYQGDELYLTVGLDNSSVPTHFVDSVAFGASVPGETFGRTPNGSGVLYPMRANTIGDRNSGPRVGPLVITEVMYAPGEPSAAALVKFPELKSEDLQYVEVHNSTGQMVDLSYWKLRLGADFDWEFGTKLAARQSMLVLPFNPANPANAARLAAFRAHYGLSNDVLLVGNFSGQLGSKGDGVQLQRPGTPTPANPTELPMLLEDEVLYSARAPWPVDAATGGKSLQRSAPDAFGDNAASWVAAAPTPGLYTVTLVGDLDQNGLVNIEDVERMRTAIRAGQNLYDLNGDKVTDRKDLDYLLNDVLQTTVGDVNLDGVFNSRDLVLLFQAAKFEDGKPNSANYKEGDWDLDGDFTNADLLLAWQAGAYVSERPAAQVAALAARDSIFQDAAFADLDFSAEDHEDADE